MHLQNLRAILGFHMESEAWNCEIWNPFRIHVELSTDLEIFLIRINVSFVEFGSIFLQFFDDLHFPHIEFNTMKTVSSHAEDV